LIGEGRGGRRRIGLQIDDLDGGRYLAIPPDRAIPVDVECIAGSIIQQRWDLTILPLQSLNLLWNTSCFSNRATPHLRARSCTALVYIDIGSLGCNDGISLSGTNPHFCLTDPLRWRVFTQCGEEHRLPVQAVRQQRQWPLLLLGFNCRAQIVLSRRLKCGFPDRALEGTAFWAIRLLRSLIPSILKTNT
jgi:hypothetical protein